MFVFTHPGAVEDIVTSHYYNDTMAEGAATALRAGTDADCGNGYDALNISLAQVSCLQALAVVSCLHGAPMCSHSLSPSRVHTLGTVMRVFAQGMITEADIDTAVTHLMSVRFRLGTCC